MKDKEDNLENLSQQSLPEPKGYENAGVQKEEKNEHIEESYDTSNINKKVDDEERMIDIPFNLFN